MVGLGLGIADLSFRAQFMQCSAVENHKLVTKGSGTLTTQPDACLVWGYSELLTHLSG